MIHARHFFHAREYPLADSFLVVIHHDHALAGVAPGSPKKIALMSADGRRQAVLGAEQIDRSRLPVGLRKDGGA